MKRSEERILTTHVGSLIRPDLLADNTAAEPYEARLRRAVDEAVQRQAETGLDIVNDGEYGKAGWAHYIMDRITGFELRENDLRPVKWMGRDVERFAETIEKDLPGATTGRPVQACTGPIAYQGRDAIARDIDNLTTALGSVAVSDAFMTVVAPASTAYDGVNDYYETEEDYVFAIAEALREEYLAVYHGGLIVQVDDAVLANMYDALTAESPHRYREWAELRVAALNHALRGIPEDRIRYHVCFGSWHVPHISDAPLEDIIDLILQVRAGAYLIEAANPRHEHEWRVWEKVKLPPEKILIPGVITHHTVTVEHPRLIADRIVRFAHLVGRENVIAGADCGFAQLEGIQRVDRDVMWAKFEALVEGGRIASWELWG